MKNGGINLASLGTAFSGVGRKIGAYRAFLFFLAVMVLYSFIVWRINVFSNTPASQSEKAAQTTAQPHIDPATVAKMQNLQDNSVSVQTLFDQARQNPFHE
ncbi:MAG TPA: hypothetical protein VLF69_04760 [Candidatus Saccharimonadales bacterium]|nr:hypothetical protein [Candidatus Saccharimonadales bacterium]